MLIICIMMILTRNIRPTVEGKKGTKTIEQGREEEGGNYKNISVTMISKREEGMK